MEGVGHTTEKSYFFLKGSTEAPPHTHTSTNLKQATSNKMPIPFPTEDKDGLQRKTHVYVSSNSMMVFVQPAETDYVEPELELRLVDLGKQSKQELHIRYHGRNNSAMSYEVIKQAMTEAQRYCKFHYALLEVDVNSNVPTLISSYIGTAGVGVHTLTLELIDLLDEKDDHMETVNALMFKLYTAFPNVETMIIKLATRVPAFNDVLAFCSWPKLKQLTIEMEVNYKWNRMETFSMRKPYPNSLLSLFEAFIFQSLQRVNLCEELFHPDLKMQEFLETLSPTIRQVGIHLPRSMAYKYESVIPLMGRFDGISVNDRATLYLDNAKQLPRLESFRMEIVSDHADLPKRVPATANLSVAIYNDPGPFRMMGFLKSFGQELETLSLCERWERTTVPVEKFLGLKWKHCPKLKNVTLYGRKLSLNNNNQKDEAVC